jgi:hypothetical protein
MPYRVNANRSAVNGPGDSSCSWGEYRLSPSALAVCIVLFRSLWASESRADGFDAWWLITRTPAASLGALVYTSPVLPRSSYSLQVRVTGKADLYSGGVACNVDRVLVVP